MIIFHCDDIDDVNMFDVMFDPLTVTWKFLRSLWQSLVIFGNPHIFSESVWKCFCRLRTTFGDFVNLQKVVRNLLKIVKNVVFIMFTK